MGRIAALLATVFGSAKLVIAVFVLCFSLIRILINLQSQQICSFCPLFMKCALAEPSFNQTTRLHQKNILIKINSHFQCNQLQAGINKSSNRHVSLIIFLFYEKRKLLRCYTNFMHLPKCIQSDQHNHEQVIYHRKISLSNV